MKVIWFIAAAAAIYGAIAGSFFEHIPLTAIAFALLAIMFILAAYRDITQSRS
jgi:membrane protein implicated in regulation of membrane protease activity